jgi:hypothetical protein
MKTADYAEMVGEAKRYRRTSATAIIHSGGKRTICGCVCGARHTTSTDWDGRNARHVVDWKAKHETSCGSVWAEITERRQPGWLDEQRDAVYSDDTH